eukprot:g37678.t1
MGVGQSREDGQVKEAGMRLVVCMVKCFFLARDGEKPKNPMVELFYGRFLAVGMHEGKKFENSEMFGQYPLQVNGFKDLHECLEAAMVEGEIESLQAENSTNSAKSGQE